MSTVFGVGVFLVLLMFCSQLLLDLWITSCVDAVAHDAATDVATSGAEGRALHAVEAQALARAREALGAYGDRLELAFEPVTDVVVLHVHGDGIDRRVVVRREAADR